MKIIKFLLSLAALLGVLHFLNYPAQIGADSIPPIGHFFNPFQGFWQNAEPMAAFAVGEKLEVPAMKGKVKIHFDERMVPHIFAENMEDAIFAQGYVVARFRLWQMDMLSRLSAGRLSEVMGENLLDLDKLNRRRGMLYGAHQSNKGWKEFPGTYGLVQAYADGVNFWLQNMPEGQRPLEFKLLDYAPENWSPLKTALVKKYMELNLCSGENDLETTNALAALGPELFRKLYPEWNPKQTPIIPRGTEWDFPPLPPTEPGEVQEAMSSIRHRALAKPAENIGSNNWAVSGAKTKSGNPILANDPHLQLTLPSIWFEVQIHTPEVNVYGVCLPGMPGVIIGFNEQVAWGVTNVGQDVLDWYRVSWADDDRSSYRYGDEVREARLVEEKYKVKNREETVTDTVRWTHWGPVVYEGDGDGKRDLAMRWLAHEVPSADEFQTFVGLSQARGYADYRKALGHYILPAQNFAFAAKNGDIAMTVNGKFPKKKNQAGRFVMSGKEGEEAWQGFIPKSQVPSMKNPARGFVASANQHSTAPDYPYYYNARKFDNYRGRYLVGQLNEMNDITVEDMMTLQNSNHSLRAEEGLTQLLSALRPPDLGEKEKDIVDRMAAWDFKYEADRVEPAIFEAWWKNVYEMAFDEVVGLKGSMSILMPEDWVLVKLLDENPIDSIFDIQKTEGIEFASDIVHAALEMTLDDLAEELIDPNFDWAKWQKPSVTHLARIKAFSKNGLDVGGTGQALNATKSNHGPSWRMVVELGDEVKGWGVYPGGQSGNPGSPYYASNLEAWSKGEYHELFFMKNENDDAQPIAFSIEIN